MALESLPVWTIPPNWRNGVVETLEFLTPVLVSPFGVEQRYGARLSPRQLFEMDFTLWGSQRTFMDMVLMRAGGLPVYVPIWTDVERLGSAVGIGASVLSAQTEFTEFPTVKAVFLRGADSFDYELAEVDSVTDTEITLADPLAKAWTKGTRVYPVKKFRLEAQPSMNRRADRAWEGRIRFISDEPNATNSTIVLNNFVNQFVLEQEPNEIQDMSYLYSRFGSDIDNQTGLRDRYDNRGQWAQQFSWFNKGRQKNSEFRGLLYALQGKRMPIWVPSFYEDFELVLNVEIGVTTLDVKRCGYSDMGGPSPNRQYILIHLKDGQRFYRKITSSAVIGDGSTERLAIDSGFAFVLTPSAIKRISFLILSRLDQDSIEIVHHTDSKGLSTCSSLFKSLADREGIEDDIKVPVVPDIYEGPGDIIDFTAWYSLSRGYSLAYSLPGTNKAARLAKVIAKTSGLVIDTCELYIKPDGTMDTDTTLACDGGTKTIDEWGQYRSGLVPNAVGTGTVDGASPNSVMTITSMTSGTFYPEMQINGSTYILSQLTGTPGGVGTYLLSRTYSSGGSATRTGTPVEIKVDIFYDQTGNGWDASPVTDRRVRFSWGGDGWRIDPDFPAVSEPDLIDPRTHEYRSASSIAPTSPIGLSAVGVHRSLSPSSVDRYVQCGGYVSSSELDNAIVISTNGTWSLGPFAGISASNDAIHAANGSIVDGTPDVVTLYLDDATNSGDDTVDTTSSPIRLFGRSGQESLEMLESGCANNILFSASILAALIVNQKAYYNIP